MLKLDIDAQLQIQDNLDTLFRDHLTCIKTIHVRDHQDKKKQGAITWLKKLNVMADKLAEESRYKTKPLHHHLPYQIVAL